MDRRRFLTTSAVATSAVLARGLLPVHTFARPAAQTRFERGADLFPLLDVSGSYFEIGKAVGKTFGASIKKGLGRRKSWFANLWEYANSLEGMKHVSAMHKAAETHTPHVVQELRGWARGAKISYRKLFVLNIKSELLALQNKTEKNPDGCSTVAYRDDNKLLLAHNEDGNKAYNGLMFMLRVTPRNGPTALVFTYPGTIEGNAAWMNEHGVFMSTNYIASKVVTPGVPRYFLSRKAMEARTVQEAVEIVSHPQRAYGYHQFIGSVPEHQLISLEANPEKVSTFQVDGLYYHTNHLRHDTMKDRPQFQDYMDRSSKPRLESLKTDLENASARKGDKTSIMEALSSHKSKPTPVCRHAKGDNEGMTFANVLMESAGKNSPKAMHLTHGPPCEGVRKAYRVKGTTGS